MESLISRIRAALDCGSDMVPILPVDENCPVSASLRQQLEHLGDPGSAVCAVRDGEVVEEVLVGTRDGATPWTVDTLVMTYSVAKPFAALTVLSVVAEGALGLDQRVADVWPEYAGHGKAVTTVRHVLSHQAGLPSFPEAAAQLEFDDRDGLIALLADATPEHPPGEGVAEHALTYGHLCDRLVRAVTGEDLAERFAAIAAAHGWDLHLRLQEGDLRRVADVVTVEEGWPRRFLDDPHWAPALGRPPGVLDPAVLNNRRWRTTSFPAIGMHASARGLARFYDQLLPADGPVAELLGPELHRGFVTSQATGHDLVLDREVSWTLGFQVDGDDIGMGGAGGCSAWYSFGGRYAAAYVTRGLGDHTRADAVWEHLESI
jgi:CubicO group peptidase (beta-lactamase class C family)